MDMIGRSIRSLTANHTMWSKVYIGETNRMLKFRLDDHRGYVNNCVDRATGSHFNQPGHSLADMSITIFIASKKKLCCIQKGT